MILIRFPNEISIAALSDEIKRLTKDFEEKDYHQLIIVEPGSVRARSL